MTADSQSTVLITGGTGLVGSALTSRLRKADYNIRILTRKKREIQDVESYHWDIYSGQIEEGAIEGVDHIIHLAGENIGDGRWSKSRKKKILDSRVMSTGLLFDTVEKRNPDLKSFTSASAKGYYGSVTSDNVFTEEDPAGDDFTANVCVQWERAAGLFRGGGYRTTIVRTGVVLSAGGGMLAKVLPTIKMRVSPLIGDGKQYLPWIHIDDLCGIYLKILSDSSIDGVYNAVAPDHLNYRQFIRTIARVKNQKVFSPPTPELAWKIIFGEKSSILLEGSRVSARKIIDAGYEFKYPAPGDALRHLLL